MWEETSVWGKKSFLLWLQHVVDGETSFVSLLIYSWQIYLEYAGTRGSKNKIKNIPSQDSSFV